MKTFETGDRIIASDFSPVAPTSTHMIYLCSVEEDRHLCVTKSDWEEKDFSCVTKYKFIETLKVIKKVKKAHEIVKWLEKHNYRVTEQGSWVHNIKSMAVFSRTMFIECGKDIENVKKPQRFIDDWLEEEYLEN